MNPARQLPLDLVPAPRYGAEDFLVSGCNEAAFRQLGRWPDWPQPLALLTGPAGSGKSHLAAIFARRAGATTVAAAALDSAAVPALVASPAVVIEDADRAPLAEHALFHLLNMAREAGRSLLITGRAPLAAWPLATADLASRLRLALPLAIEPPDDALLRVLLVKLFLDRQLAIDTQVIEFIATRIERSFDACRDVVDALDREAMARGRGVGRALAAEILTRMDDLRAEP